jgi:hypothetical protein
VVHCGSQYGVYIRGIWTWFSSYAEAAQVEAEILAAQVAKKRKRGEQMILTADMGHSLWTAAPGARQRTRHRAEMRPGRYRRAKQA